MKLICLFMFVALLQVSASSYSQTKKLTLVGKNLSLEEVFELIEDQSEFSFLYNLKQVDLSKEVDVDFKNEQVEKILNYVLKGSNITYTVDNRLIVIHKEKEFDLNVSVAETQQKAVSGKVTDSGGQPLPGVTVVVKGTTQGTVTNADGEYSLSNIPEDATLAFSFVGMRTQEVVVGNQTSVDVTMEEEVIGIEEVVAIGYGEQSRAKLTSSISKLDPQVLENSTFARAESALQGTIPGVRVFNRSGRPGSSPDVILRGGATISGNKTPLYIVDGIVRSLEGISPNDIESIQVLKDAASTAIYGARANNGVVLVTTKKGKYGSSKVSYSLNEGINVVRKDYNYLSTRDYIYYNRLAVKNTNEAYAQGGRAPLNVYNYMGFGGYNNKEDQFDIRIIGDENRSEFSSLLDQGWEYLLDPYTSGADTIMYKDHYGEVEDAVFNNFVRTSNHHLSFSGADEKGSFLSSIGYYKQDGNIYKTFYERFSGKLKGSYKIKDYLEVFGEVTYSESKQPPQIIDEWRWFYSIRGAMPTFDPYDDEGNPTSGFHEAYGNPLYWHEKYVRKNKTRRSTYNLGADFRIIPELHLKIQGNTYQVDYQVESFDKAYRKQGNPVTNTDRKAGARYEKSDQSQLNLIIDYKKNFDTHHNLHVLAGGELFDFSKFTLLAAGRGAPTDDIYTLNAATERTNISSTKDQYRIASLFGRINYEFKDKYLFTGVIRYDGISRLSEKNRWGFFPGISAGWNLHKESFFKNSNLSNNISTLKPRISFGVNGNISGLGNYEVQGLYGLQTLYNGQAGFLNTSVINKNLRWEKSSTIDIGVDLGMYNNRLNLLFDYFRRTTNDLLTNLSLPEYTGFSSIRTNLGSLLNKGIELAINIDIIRNQNGLNWNVGANASYVKNKVLKLPYNGNENNRQGGSQVFDPEKGEIVWVGGIQEGKELGDVYAYKQIRILKDWDDVYNNVSNRYDKIAELYGPDAYEALNDKTGKYMIEPGDVLWADLDGNDEINSLDRVKIGNVNPKWTGGVSSNVSFKNISCLARFDYALGHIIYNDLVAQTLGQYGGFPNMIDWVKDSWSEDNPNTDLPKFYYQDFPKLNLKRSGLHYRTMDDHSSILYEKGDYLALKELTLSYNILFDIVQKLKLSNLKINLTSENLIYFTKYSGTNPENGGIDQGRYPLPRTFTLGIKADF